jgi:hypothetical protein
LGSAAPGRGVAPGPHAANEIGGDASEARANPGGPAHQTGKKRGENAARATGKNSTTRPPDDRRPWRGGLLAAPVEAPARVPVPRLVRGLGGGDRQAAGWGLRRATSTGPAAQGDHEDAQGRLDRPAARPGRGSGGLARAARGPPHVRRLGVGRAEDVDHEGPAGRRAFRTSRLTTCATAGSRSCTCAGCRRRGSASSSGSAACRSPPTPTPTS